MALRFQDVSPALGRGRPSDGPRRNANLLSNPSHDDGPESRHVRLTASARSRLASAPSAEPPPEIAPAARPATPTCPPRRWPPANSALEPCASRRSPTRRRPDRPIRAARRPPTARRHTTPSTNRAPCAGPPRCPPRRLARQPLRRATTATPRPQRPSARRLARRGAPHAALARRCAQRRAIGATRPSRR